MTTAHSCTQKQTLECKLSASKVLSQSVHKQTHNASVATDFSVSLQMFSGSLRQALQQPSSGAAVQTGLKKKK